MPNSNPLAQIDQDNSDQVENPQGDSKIVATGKSGPTPLEQLQDEIEKASSRSSELDDLLKQRLAQSKQIPWFSIASGLANPGKTGNFFEGLGRAAGNVESYQKEQRDALDNIVKQRQELNATQLGLAQKRFGTQLMDNGQGGIGAPGGPLSSSGNPKLPYDPTIAAVAKSAGVDALEGANNNTINAQQFAAQQNATQTIAAPEMGPGMHVDLNQQQIQGLNDARSKGIGREYLSKLFAGNENGVTYDSTGRAIPVSLADFSHEAGAAKGQGMANTAVGLSSQDLDSRGGYLARGINADKDVPLYSAYSQLLKKPHMDEIMGMFERQGILPILGQISESGGGLNSMLRLPQVQNIRNLISSQYGPDAVADMQTALGMMAQIDVNMRGQAKGSGSITNFDQEMFNQIGPTMFDTVKTQGRKVAMLAARSQYDQALRKLVLDGASPTQLPNLKAYNDITKTYNDQLKAIIGADQSQQNQIGLQNSAANADQPIYKSSKAANQPRNDSMAREKLRKLLGQGAQ